ncbi:MAG: hypothetical protein CME68_03355 [Halobacteriovoraceae bacterium]|nr:hypothetical protein [Halobacteriovoraceae bacterium]
MGNLKPKLLVTNNIHILRAEKKLTQQQRADEIGVTRLTVSSLYNAQGYDTKQSAKLFIKIK